MWSNKEFLVFVSGFWHIASKTPGISYYANEVTYDGPLDSFSMVSRKTNNVIRELGFGAHPSSTEG